VIKIKFFVFALSLVYSNIIFGQDCIIIPSKGLNSILAGESEFKDVHQEFGKKKVQKTWIKSIETELFGRYDRYVIYDSIARFSTAGTDRHRKIVHAIKLDEQSTCRTKNGFGIGSSYVKTLDNLGIPWLVMGDMNGYLTLSYDNMRIVFDTKDSLTNKVIKIDFYNR
jgi:hypothetical protein